MSGWPRKIPDRSRYRKERIEALENTVRSLRRQILKSDWTAIDIEVETLRGYSATGQTPKEWARNETAVLEQAMQAREIAQWQRERATRYDTPKTPE